MPEPGWHLLGSTGHTAEPITWLQERGYNVTFMGSDGFAPAGLLFSRTGQPPLLAVVGQYLVWDGQDVTVSDTEPA